MSGDLPSLQLNAEGAAKLTRFRHTLFGSLIKLLHSERSDWGYPLLVGIARLHALQQSVDTGRLVVLDRFHATDDNRSISIDDDNLRAVIEFANDALKSTSSRLSSSEELDEHTYGEIEIRFGTLLQVNAVRSDQPLRLPAVDTTPSRPAKVELISLPLSIEALSDYERQYKSRAEAYLEQLSALYDYQLLSRNCVTGIFEVINDSLALQFTRKPGIKDSIPEPVRQISERLLGGYIDAANLNIVPFAAFDQVGSEYRLDSSYRLPPYREQQIEKRYQADTDVLVDMLESNVVTSSIYRWHGEDAAFLFFTQDAVWPRPLLGGLNLTTALGQTVYGLFALPWDAGQNLQKGLKGIFVSIPELLFFNIRKGSFPKLIPESGNSH